MDVDKTREIKEKDPNKSARRPIKSEAVWLEDFPGESPELGPKRKKFWVDKGLREDFGIPAHVKAPEFVFPGRRPTARDPRDFPDDPQWRDSLMGSGSLGRLETRLYEAYLIDRKINKGAVSPELLASGHEELAPEGEPRCVCILDPSGENPPVDYHQLLDLVEKGQDTQTIAF